MRDENATFMAGSLAYHAFVSLVPLVALLFLGLAVVGSEPLAERVLTLVGSLLSPEVSAIPQRHVDGIADGIVVLVTGPVALLVVVFLPLYYVFPDTDVSVREVLPGAAVAALGWMVLQQLFQVYVSQVGTSAGGVVGAVILSLTWMYFAGVVLLVGCAVNAVHGGYHGMHT